MSTALASRPEISVAPGPEPSPRRWTRDEFYRMAEVGLFRFQRSELIEGEIMVFSPQGPSHSSITDGVADALRNGGWPGVWVRMQLPVDFGVFSEPEPDVSVVAGARKDYKTAHPTTALLVVEVSDTALAYDRGRKASLYAKMGIADYWIVDVNGEQLEVRRDPRPDPGQPLGWGYATEAVLKAGDHVSPLGAPAIRIAVVGLLPQ